jgi:hypothetical protein
MYSYNGTLILAIAFVYFEKMRNLYIGGGGSRCRSETFSFFSSNIIEFLRFLGAMFDDVPVPRIAPKIHDNGLF